MKLNRTLAIGAIALATSSYASAALNIYVVASNGDRSATQKGIETLLAANGGWHFQGNKGTSTNGSDANALNSNYGAWNGTYSGTNVVIRTSYIGAAGAVRSLAGLQPERYVVADGSGTNSTLDIYTSGSAVLNGNATNGYTTNTPNFAFSTVFQATTPYNGTYQGITFDSLSEILVGVSPIVFVASQGSPVTNITTQLAQSLYSSGYLSAFQFTGNQADTNTIIYPIGRNTDAGQRYAVLAEIGLGTSATLNQWSNTITGATTNAGDKIVHGGTVTSQVLWPRETVSGLDSGSAGNSGYTTGALLASALTISSFSTSAIKDTFGNAIPGATAAYYVGYITTGDYTTTVATNSSATLLSYNGVPYTSNNVVNGAYTAWVYNRILERSDARNSSTNTLGNATVAAFKDDLGSTITTTTGNANGGILVGTLNVGRTADGGLVTPN